MSDAERKHAIKILTEWYSPGDYQAASMYMPKEKTDQSGAEFNEYFDFLQTLFLVKGEFMMMEETELRRAVTVLMSKATKFGYPTNQLEAL